MAYTASFSVNVGDPTKATDISTLAANDDYLKAAADAIMHDSATPTAVLKSGVSATTQSAGNNTTLVATTAFVTTAVAASSTSPAGSNTQVQYNNSSSFGASANLTFGSDVLTVASSDASLPKIEIKNTHADATAGILQFTKDTASGADSDAMGTISFFGTDASNNTEQELAKIEGIVAEADHGTETGKLSLSVAEYDGTVTSGLALTGSATDGEIDVTIGAGVNSVTEISGLIKAAAMPCFSVLLNSTQSDVTGDGTHYPIPFNSARFDQGSDVTTTGGGSPAQGTFTAPVNGRYWIKAMVRISSGLTLDHTECAVIIVTSNTSYYAHLGPAENVGGQQFEINGSALADMEATDICQIKVDIRNDAKTVDIGAGSYIQGYLVCGF